MPLIVTGGRGRWDRTPRRRVWTERYRIVSCPGLGPARAAQREAYDWALGELERSPALPVRAAAGCDSLYVRLTTARADGTLPNANLRLQRAAVAQAHESFTLRDANAKEKAKLVDLEQGPKVHPRVLRRLRRPAKAPGEYLRSHPSNRRKRQAIAVLDGVAAKGPRAVHVPGLGTVAVDRDLVDAPRSAQVLEEQGRPAWLHVQHGERLAPAKDPYGTVTGLDSGIRHTLTGNDGAVFDRPAPDTRALVNEAKQLVRHAKRHCTRGSRQDRRLRAKARDSRQVLFRKPAHHRRFPSCRDAGLNLASLPLARGSRGGAPWPKIRHPGGRVVLSARAPRTAAIRHYSAVEVRYWPPCASSTPPAPSFPPTTTASRPLNG